VAKFKIVVAPLADKQLRKFTTIVQLRIVAAITKLANDPQRGKRLRGALKDYWSYRVGDYRVIYFIRERKIQIEIIRIAHRREVYK
jgi:mRNA interferase RelE/StbE